jgi:hypothetical protein
MSGRLEQRVAVRDRVLGELRDIATFTLTNGPPAVQGDRVAGVTVPRDAGHSGRGLHRMGSHCVVGADAPAGLGMAGGGG